MAIFEFKLPDIGEGVTEGEIVSWHVKEGDRVAEDQVMVEVMTDKATVTIGAPRAGKIDKLAATVGSIVKVGDVLVVIQTGNGSRMAAQLPAATAVGDIRDSLPGTGYFGEKRAGETAKPGGAPASASSTVSAAGTTTVARSSAAPQVHAPAGREAEPTVAETRAVEPGREPEQATANGNGHFAEKPLATPATRKLARDMTVDLRRVPGSGPGGRVTREDVMAYGSADEAQAPRTARVPPTAATSAQAVTPRKPPGPAAGTRVPFVGIRRRIAENMAASKSTAAHFTFVEECEVDRLIELRDRLRPEARARGADLTYLPFVIKAVVAALKKNALLNSSLDVASNELVLHDRYHIGIAAATDQGLVVPVVHDADQLSLLALALEVERLAQAARENKLTVADLSGSTFTVTSLGKQAGLFAVPIINLPNVGILGVHRIKERPVVRDGQIVIGQVMLLSLSLDHRIVDGHVGAAFAYDVIHYLEDPARLLLEG
jgi:pyruvate dehydrogenase E2 component (dihydrolipoamide acetyltransferase)